MPRIVFHDPARYGSVAPLDKPELARRVRAMLDVDDLLRTTHQQDIFKDPDLIYCEVAAGLPLYEVMYQEHDSALSRDDRLLLQQKIEQSVPIHPDDVAARNPVGALGIYDSSIFHRISGPNDWMLFVREYLRISPGTSVQFQSECKMAFPKLRFSTAFPACLDTMEGGHASYTNAVVDCFSALNDEWFNCFNGDFIVDALDKLGAVAKHPASMEGNAKRKPALTFTFLLNGKAENYLCEPHLKIRSPDQAGDGSRNNERIYFYPRSVDGSPGIILVGHAGQHL